MDESWLPTLTTSTPQEGFELAIKLSQLGMMISQSFDSDGPQRHAIQPEGVAQLIGTAHVIAVNFQTVAAANDWWRHIDPGHNGS